MRFLFILERHKKSIEEVIGELNVSDIEIVAVGKSEREITPALLQRIIQNKTGIGLCEIDRSYRKSLGDIKFDFQTKSFRAEDFNLRDWLVATPPAVAQTLDSPSVCFQDACAREPRLVLAEQALEKADEIAVHRHAFAMKAASLLAKYAASNVLGPLRDWGNLHGVNFAPNGQVIYTCKLPGRHAPFTTQWHLTEGKKTTPQAAARVYFGSTEVNGSLHILVFYVGPHPPPGTYEANFNNAIWQPLDV